MRANDNAFLVTSIRRARAPGLGLSMALALALLVLTLSAARFSGADDPRTDGGRVLIVATLGPERQSGYPVERVFVGRVEAARTSELGFELGGLLLEAIAEEGDRVTANEVLARLDTDRLEARRRELIAAHEQARADLALAKVTLKRFEGVVDAGGISRQGLDEAREAYRAAEAAVRVASSRIDTVEVDLSKSVLRAPYDAVVTRRWVDEGRVLPAGSAVFELMEQVSPEVRIGIAGELIERLEVGQRRSLEMGGAQVPATVKAILPVKGAGTRTVDVILVLEADIVVRSGDLASLRITDTIPRAGYWLPLDALAEGARGLWTVYRLTETHGPSGPTASEHRVVPQVVEVLHTEPERVYVAATLPEPSLIVASGVHRVVPGQRVQPVDAAAVAATEGSDGHVYD